QIGQGGMGVVYKAEDTKLERTVALKFLSQSLIGGEEENERFKREARAAAALNHPNIATIYAIEEFEDEMFIVMEYIEGRELKSIIDDRQLSIDDIRDYAAQIAAGLQAAHKKGVTHRDIKSANIMITDEGQVRIMDFGLAKLGGGAQLTKDHSTLGTAAYMSPEQAQGLKTDHRTDIWAFGVVLYEMLTGELPFKGDYEPAVIYSILNVEPEYPDGLPTGLQPILEKTLAKNPADRYHDTTAMLSDLESAKEETPKNKAKTAAKHSGVQIPVYMYAAGIILAIVLLAGVFFWPPNSKSQSINSIAVLPMDNISGDSTQDYFADGMTDALITDLSKIGALKVISRTSVMQFKNVDKTLPKIANELGVDAVIVGTVLMDGEQVRISTQLVEAETDKNLWSESYDRSMTNILALQREIALAIVDQIKIVLSTEEQKQIGKRSTENTDAYQLYLQGRYHWNKRSEEAINKSIDYFQQAIEKDATFALAYAGLGDAYLMHGIYGRQRPDKSMALAKTYLEKALQLDRQLAEVYATLGDINIHFDWDLDAAESNFRRAIEINPRYAHTYHWYSEVFLLRGEFERSYQVARQALQLDPYAVIINAQLGRHYRHGGDVQKSIAQLLKSLEFDSTVTYVYRQLGIAYLTLNQFDAAIHYLQNASALEPEDMEILSDLGFVESMAGNKQEAAR
ncbi:MAG: protein kinase, partial [bacterium]